MENDKGLNIGKQKYESGLLAVVLEKAIELNPDSDCSIFKNIVIIDDKRIDIDEFILENINLDDLK